MRENNHAELFASMEADIVEMSVDESDSEENVGDDCKKDVTYVPESDDEEENDEDENVDVRHFREPLAPGKPQMREPCGPMCRKRCTNKISEE